MSDPRDPSAHEYVLRRALPLPLVVLGGSLELVGLGLVVWAPHGFRLVLGVVIILAGMAALLLGVLGWYRSIQRIGLDRIGIRLGMPRPADIAWAEIVAVHEAGRVLKIDLRDRTQFVVDGDAYPRGYPEFRDGLLARLAGPTNG